MYANSGKDHTTDLNLPFSTIVSDPEAANVINDLITEIAPETLSNPLPPCPHCGKNPIYRVSRALPDSHPMQTIGLPYVVLTWQGPDCHPSNISFTPSPLGLFESDEICCVYCDEPLPEGELRDVLQTSLALAIGAVPGPSELYLNDADLPELMSRLHTSKFSGIDVIANTPSFRISLLKLVAYIHRCQVEHFYANVLALGQKPNWAVMLELIKAVEALPRHPWTGDQPRPRGLTGLVVNRYDQYGNVHRVHALSFNHHTLSDHNQLLACGKAYAAQMTHPHDTICFDLTDQLQL